MAPFTPPPPVPDSSSGFVPPSTTARTFVPPPPSSRGSFTPPPPTPDTNPVPPVLRSAIPKVVDLLNRGSMATMAGRQRGIGAGLQTLLHSETPEQYQKDSADISQADLKHAGIPDAEYAKLPGWERWGVETTEQVKYDPLTYLGGSGLTKDLVEQAGEHALPGIMRASQWAMAHPSELSTHAQRVAKIASGIHNAMMGGGENAAHALRTLALEKGREGVQDFQRLYALRGAGQHIAGDFQKTLTEGFDRAIKGLKENDRLAIFNAIHRGTIDKLPTALQDAARQIVNYDRAIPYVLGSKALRTKLETELGYTLPTDLARFKSEVAHGAVRANQFLQNHVPLVHELDAEHAAVLLKRIDAGLKGKKDLLTTLNPQFRERAAGAKWLTQDANLIEDMFRSSFARAGKQLGGAMTIQRVKSMFAPTRKVTARMAVNEDVIHKAINAANKLAPKGQQQLTRLDFDKLGKSVQDVLTGPLRPTKVTREMQHLRDVPVHIRNFFKEEGEQLATAPWKQALREYGSAIGKRAGVAKATGFAMPQGHMFRIGSLLLAHAPQAIPGALSKFARMRAGFAPSEKIAEVLGEAAHAGATGVPNIEQKNLEEALGKFGVVGQKLAQHYRNVGKVLWHWDDAAKAALFDAYKEQYKDPLIAAYHVQQDLVNYGAQSPFIKNVGRFASSFPTWRTRMPIAVARAIAKKPHIAGLIAKTAPWLLGGSIMVGGQEKKFYGSALTEGVEAGEQPMKYLRSSLRPSAKIAGTLALSAIPGISAGQAKWPTSGAGVIPFAASQLPYVGTGASLFGHGLFPGSPADAAQFQLLNLGNVPASKPKGIPRRPSVMELLRKQRAAKNVLF